MLSDRRPSAMDTAGIRMQSGAAGDPRVPGRLPRRHRDAPTEGPVLDGRAAADHDERVTRRPIPRRGRHEVAEPATIDEEQLLRSLYEEHAKPLLVFVLRLTGGDRQRAEDVVQETLLRAWRNAHKLGTNGAASLRPWLVTVARRIVIDEHRSRSVRPTETDDGPLESLPSADETDRILQLMTITDALRTLSPAHREAVVETYFRGRTVQEASESLGLPVGTVKSRVYYALRALRVALEERGVTA
jgi:RNA polymerase sigma-70 factor (ECF subfamily)